MIEVMNVPTLNNNKGYSHQEFGWKEWMNSKPEEY